MTKSNPSEFLTEVLDWQKATFPEETVEQALNHLQKELVELMDSGSPLELADCFLLLIAVAHLKGINSSLVFELAQIKHRMNIHRTWIRTPEGDYQHEE